MRSLELIAVDGHEAVLDGRLELIDQRPVASAHRHAVLVGERHAQRHRALHAEALLASRRLCGSSKIAT